MNAVISDKRKPIDETNPLLSLAKSGNDEAETKDDKKMKDKKRIDSFITKHKKVLEKLAK